MKTGHERKRDRNIVWILLAFLGAKLLLDAALFALRLGDEAGPGDLAAFVRFALPASLLLLLAGFAGARSRFTLYALAPCAAVSLVNAGVFLGVHLATHRLGQRLYRVKLSYGSTLAEVFRGQEAFAFGAELLFWGMLVGFLLLPNVRAVLARHDPR